MSDLPSMLVPLAGGHFPGWPASEAPSVTHLLLIIVGIPLAIGAVIALLVFSRELIRRGQGNAIQLREPLWLGQTAGVKELTTGARELDTTTGGASVRW